MFCPHQYSHVMSYSVALVIFLYKGLCINSMCLMVGLKRVGKIVLEYSAVLSHEYSSTPLLRIH